MSPMNDVSPQISNVMFKQTQGHLQCMHVHLPCGTLWVTLAPCRELLLSRGCSTFELYTLTWVTLSLLWCKCSYPTMVEVALVSRNLVSSCSMQHLPYWKVVLSMQKVLSSSLSFIGWHVVLQRYFVLWKDKNATWRWSEPTCKSLIDMQRTNW